MRGGCIEGVGRVHRGCVEGGLLASIFHGCGCGMLLGVSGVFSGVFFGFVGVWQVCFGLCGVFGVWCVLGLSGLFLLWLGCWGVGVSLSSLQRVGHVLGLLVRYFSCCFGVIGGW